VIVTRSDGTTNLVTELPKSDTQVWIRGNPNNEGWFTLKNPSLGKYLSSQSSADISVTDPYLKVDYTHPTPNSEAMRYFGFEDIREFVQPYEKRAYLSDKKNFTDDGFSQWAANRTDLIAEGWKNNTGMNYVAQNQICGGKNSKYHTFGLENTHTNCHSWRDKITLCSVNDTFYDPRDETAVQYMKKFVQENDNCIGAGKLDGTNEYTFCDKDLRLLGLSFGMFTDKDGGVILDNVREKYFDSEEKYQKLVNIKRLVDPNYTFTANTFGVDASNAPEGKKVSLKPKQHIDS